MKQKIKKTSIEVDKNGTKSLKPKTTHLPDSKRTTPKVKNAKSFSDLRGHIKTIKHKMNPHRELLINMELANGHHTTFYVLVNGTSFIYSKKIYYVDDELKYYNLQYQSFCLDYHENIAIPIQRRIDETDIRRNLTKLYTDDIDQAINPANLGSFITSKIIEGMIKGASIEEWIRFVKLMIIINTLILVIFFGLFLQWSGVLANFSI